MKTNDAEAQRMLNIPYRIIIIIIIIIYTFV